MEAKKIIVKVLVLQMCEDGVKNLCIFSNNLTKENMFIGTSAFTPFAINHFSACSLGTSKKDTSKSVSPTADKITAIRRKTISDVGALIIETLNYFDS
jgi:hypothetical protein